VLFHHTNTQEEIDSARKYNAQFDGIGPSQLDGFAKLLATSKDKLEEKFRNIEIRQDGPLGLVTFNYDLSSTTRFTIQASKSGRCSKLMAVEDLVRCLDDLSIVTADSQQRSREQGELMPGDCAGPLKKGKRMVISPPSAEGRICLNSLCTMWHRQDVLALGRRWADRAYKRRRSV